MCWKRLNIANFRFRTVALCLLLTAYCSAPIPPSNQPPPPPHRVATTYGWLFPSDRFHPATQLAKKSRQPKARRSNLFAESFGPRPLIAEPRRFGADDHLRPAETEQ